MNDPITTSEERELELRARLSPDHSTLDEGKKKLLDFALSYDHGTPYFKVKHFVGDAQVTAYAKYKQFILELRTREEIIENFLMNIAKQEATIEVTYEELREQNTPARVKLKEFELITNKNDLNKLHRRLEQAYRERDHFFNAIQEMYDTGEAYLPDGTDLKDAINDPVKDYALEAEHWRYRLGKQAALDILSTGKIGSGNMDAISMMNEEDAVSSLNIALNWAIRVENAMGQLHTSALKSLTNKPFSLDITETSPVAELE